MTLHVMQRIHFIPERLRVWTPVDSGQPAGGAISLKLLPLMIELRTPHSVIVCQMCVAVSSLEASDDCHRYVAAMVEPR